jgi:hypothetical protein
MLALVAAMGPAPARAAAPAFDFSDWHFPVPAGDWLISRGPCGGSGTFSHQCGYFEDDCAFDLTPLTGSMEHVPVLAPQAGQVFFAGNRTDSGLSVMLLHADGRVSALLHLSRIVVAADARVTQGQVVGYAGSTGSSTGPHLHFDVQPNAVERSCLPLDTIDELDRRTMTVVSHNLAWSELALVDPPATLPAWLPLAGLGAAAPAMSLPGEVALAPGASFSLPVAVQTALLPLGGLRFSGRLLAPVLVQDAYTVFQVPLTAPTVAGRFSRLMLLRPEGERAPGRKVAVRFTVRTPPDTSTGTGMIVINPTFLSPPNYSVQSRPPQLCWSESASAGPPPLIFRVMVAGPQAADSGWISASCWETPTLPPGQYSWKVFVRDGQGWMIRPNQRPWVFRMR